MTDDYVVRLPGGCVVLSSKLALLDVQRALRLSVAAGLKDGYATPRRIRMLIEELDHAASAIACAEVVAEVGQAQAGSASGSDVAKCGSDVSAWGASAELDAKEAADMLQISDRQIRNRAVELGGRKVGRAWWFDRAVIVHEAAQRNRRKEIHG